jgi:hypothetical protein
MKQSLLLSLKYICTKQILWNPRWTTGIGLTGGEEHEHVFSKLYLYAYVLKHMAKHSNRASYCIY